MRIYTRGGDKGTTSLIGGDRVAKDDLRVDAYGSVDELSATLAYLRDTMPANNTAFETHRADLLSIQKKLMRVEALLCACTEMAISVPCILDSDIEQIENRIDAISQNLKPLDKFTIPGGHPIVSWSHVCRTVCRRAERAAVKASHEYEISENAITYLNRLSDYLYVLGRKLSAELGTEELYWDTKE